MRRGKEPRNVDIVSLLLVAVALSMDAFAVAVTSGIVDQHITPQKVTRLALFFGFFQFLMPLLGWALGSAVSEYIAAVDHWLAFLLLSFIGIRMVREACRKENPDKAPVNPFTYKNLLYMAVATSIDALAVGISFALTGERILYSCVVIGIVTFSLSVVGVLMGKRVGALFQKRAEVLGGLILVGIGVKILLEHLF